MPRADKRRLRVLVDCLSKTRAEVVLVDIFGGRDVVAVTGRNHRYLSFVAAREGQIDFNYVAELHPLR